MELRHLRYFIAVAEEGHLTRAAERIGIQQPPLSQQIRALERELDARLFHRKPRGMELTDAGRAYLGEARAIIANLELASETARRAARGEQGRICVGVTSAAAFHPLVPRIVRAFRAAFPLVSFALEEDLPSRLVERTRDGQVDATFIRTPIPDQDALTIQTLRNEPMLVALPSGHRLAQGTTTGPALPLQALSAESFIFLGRTQGVLEMQSNAVVAACQAAGFTPHISQIATHSLSRLNLIAAGLGIGIVAAAMQRMNIEGITFRRLKGVPHLKVPLNVCSRRDDKSAVVGQFLKCARRTAREDSYG
jgi:DNA-binding transcriptional LysR family regulator